MADQFGAPMPRSPRPADLTLSELIPLRSRKVSFLRSRALIPLVFTTVMCLLLYKSMNDVDQIGDTTRYMTYVAYFVSGVFFLTIYYYSGERKNLLWYLVPFLITLWQASHTFDYYAYLFRDILPGDVDHAGPGFPSQFRAYFFAAGLTEETFKAVPIVLALGVAALLRSRPDLSNPVTRGLALEGPIDGLLMGVAAGLAFTLDETLGQYVPETIAKVGKVAQDESLGYVFGFLLLLPRVADGVIGHSGYAGIFGYFAGLAVSHPRATWKLLPIGLLVAAVLHTLWDSLDALIPEPYDEWITASLTLLVFFGCLMKAKQLEVSRIGGPVDGRSILAVSPPPESRVIGPAGIVPPQAPGIGGAFTRVATAIEGLAGFQATTTVPPPGAMADVVPAHGLSIGTATERYAMSANTPVDFSALFPGTPPGCLGLISAAAGGALEVANTGASGWAAASPDGSTVPVPPGGRLAARPGMRLLLGPTTITIETF